MNQSAARGFMWKIVYFFRTKTLEMTPTYDSFIFLGDPFGTNIHPSGGCWLWGSQRFFVLSVSQVRSPGQRRGVAHPELRARSVPHPVQNCVGAVERLLRDGHAGHEEGKRQGPQFSRRHSHNPSLWVFWVLGVFGEEFRKANYSHTRSILLIADRLKEAATVPLTYVQNQP